MTTGEPGALLPTPGLLTAQHQALAAQMDLDDQEAQSNEC